MFKKSILFALIALAAMMSLAACEKDTTEKAVDAVEDAADATGDAIEDAADATGDAAEDAADSVREATE